MSATSADSTLSTSPNRTWKNLSLRMRKPSRPSVSSGTTDAPIVPLLSSSSCGSGSGRPLREAPRQHQRQQRPQQQSGHPAPADGERAVLNTEADTRRSEMR